jgi:hypothetical protein
LGTIVAQAIIDKVAGAILNDRNKVRFLQADLLASLNEAQRVVVAIDPSAYSTYLTFTCASGVKQALPSNVSSLLGVSHNLAAGVPGRTIDVVKRETLDIPNPNWRKGTQKTEVRHIVADDEAPSFFDVYPPVVGGTQIVLKVAMIPADTAADVAITLEDTYESALMNYMLFRAYSKNSEFAGNAERATMYYQAFMGLVATKGQVDPASSAEGKTREAAQ